MRAFAARLLVGWPVTDDAVWCVSELAANAVVHSASGRLNGMFSVRLDAVRGEYVRVEVSDQGGPWARHEQRDDRPHGLDIVSQLAARCGVDGDARSGWTVWARLDLPGRSAAATAGGHEHGVPGAAVPTVNGRASRLGREAGPARPAHGEASWRG